MAKKNEEKDLTIEVFEGLQDIAQKSGAKASLTLDRPDGWRWRLEVIPPDSKDETEES